jgi:hypothetical protein
VNSDTVIALVSLVAGSLLTFGLESIRHRRARRESVADSRRLERSKAYVDFLDASHEAAHLLGRATKGCPNPVTDIAGSYWRVDDTVSRRIRVIEVLGGDEVVARADALRRAIVAFRTDLGKPGMTYASDEYWSAYQPVASARRELIEAARADLRVG